jgi:hypothetical protein
VRVAAVASTAQAAAAALRLQFQCTGYARACLDTPTSGNGRNGSSQSPPSSPFYGDYGNLLLALGLLPWSLVAAQVVGCSRCLFVG